MMIAHRAVRTHRHRRPPRPVFALAHAPLRRTWQGRQRDTREPLYPQVELHPDDLPPVSVQRARHYRYVPLLTPRPAWHRQCASVLVLLVAAVLLWGLR